MSRESGRSMTHDLHKGYTFSAERMTRDGVRHTPFDVKPDVERRHVQGV